LPVTVMLHGERLQQLRHHDVSLPVIVTSL
jgi:hypothetical protein